MTEERVAPWIVRQIESNLWAILAAAGALYGGYVTGTTTLNHRIDALEKSVAELRADVKSLTPRVDRVEVAAEMEREERMKKDDTK
jgi:hypothetical protein